MFKNHAFNITSQERLVLIFVITLALLGLSINFAIKSWPVIQKFSQFAFSEDIYQPKLDINKASADAFIELPGIGSVIANRIVQYREKNGEFRSLEELKRINGISDKKFKNLEKFITIN